MVRTPDSRDFSESELEELVAELRAADPDVPVSLDAGYKVLVVERLRKRYSPAEIKQLKQAGPAELLWEVVEIVATVGGAAEAVLLSVAGVRAAITWAKRRWTKDKEADPDGFPRPIVVEIFDAPEVPQRFLIDLPRGEAVGPLDMDELLARVPHRIPRRRGGEDDQEDEREDD